jgi:hypothetical protein
MNKLFLAAALILPAFLNLATPAKADEIWLKAGSAFSVKCLPNNEFVKPQPSDDGLIAVTQVAHRIVLLREVELPAFDDDQEVFRFEGDTARYYAFGSSIQIIYTEKAVEPGQ